MTTPTSVAICVCIWLMMTSTMTSCLGTRRNVRSSTTIATTAFTTPDGSDTIVSARCRVRCLSNLKQKVDPLISRMRETISLMTCSQDVPCTNCLKPCSQPAFSEDTCDDVCTDPVLDKSCLESCRFLRSIRGGIDQGLCLLQDAVDSELPCDRSCLNDSDCDIGWKCCRTSSCNYSCQKASLDGLADELPEIPGSLTLKEKPKTSSIELKWNSITRWNNSDPVLYIVEWRWNIGRHHVPSNMTDWQQIAQTTGAVAVINDVAPGRWYQFRLSAVNIFGCKGSSVPTKPFTPSKEPRRPGPPSNLTEGDTLIIGDKMAVTVLWFPPAKSDLPVSRYKIFWIKRSRQGSSHQTKSTPAPEHRHILPGDQLNYQISNMESDTTYLVHAQAICQYGDLRLKSERASIYITTYPLPNFGPTDLMPFESAGSSLRSPATLPPVLSLSASQPFYQAGLLKANITWHVRTPGSDSKSDPPATRFRLSWSPGVCIADSSLSDLSRSLSDETQNEYFTIYHLHPDCRYVVKAEVVSTHGAPSKPAIVSFFTPSCGQAPVIDTSRPECLNNIFRIPGKPVDMVHSFLISSSNITSRVTWSHPPSDSPITSYRIVWGPIASLEHDGPVADRIATFTSILSKDARNFSIFNLLEATNYLVQVQAVSKIGLGQAASLQFSTPLLQIVHNEPPYREVMPAYNPENKKQEVSRRKQTITNKSVVVRQMDRTTWTVAVSQVRSHTSTFTRPLLNPFNCILSVLFCYSHFISFKWF